MRVLAWLAVAAASTCGAFARAGDEKPEPVRPQDGVIKLFSGKDLTGLYTWLKDAKREDPKKVFTVHDGMIHVSGAGHGYVATARAYRDYHLVVEYKWGA